MHDPERETGGGPWDGPESEVLGGPAGERQGRTSPAQLWRRRSARGRAVVTAAAVGVLALGGTVAYAATSDGPGGPSAGGSASASPSPDGPGKRHGHGDGWFGRGGPGVHGEATVKDPDTGKWVVRTWQRGTVDKADGDRVTVRSEDGASWTWTVNGDTAVHRFGGPDSGAPKEESGAGALKKGDQAVLVGTRAGDGTRTAAQVVAGDLDRLKDDLRRFKDDLHRFRDDLHGFEDRAPGDGRGGEPFRGPHGWDDGPSDHPSDHPSDRPEPSESGATT
ncbi:hypothetical protein [Streptomyces griseosporeus]|uniref:hypothetical protein n=1 Tax=Streptomyces griseosporeus TaxID=1910 RepID=UPI003701C2D8